MSSYMYNYLTLEFICAKDDNIGHSVTYDIKKCTCAQCLTRVGKYVQSTVKELPYMSLNNRVYDR